MSIPLQFASLYDGQVFVWFDCILDFGTDFLVGNIVYEMHSATAVQRYES